MKPSGEELYLLRERGVSWPDIYTLYPNIKPSTLRKRHSRYAKKQDINLNAVYKTATGVHPGRINSVPKLFQAFGADPEDYKLVNLIINTWEQHSNTSGFKTLYQIKARIEPQPHVEATQKLDAIRAAFRKESQEHKLPARNSNNKKTHLITYNLPDVHLGKHTTTHTTPHDYNLQIAIDTYKTAVKDLVQRTKHIQPTEVWLPTGNDLMHVDNTDGTTTAGTHVHPDTNFLTIWAEANTLIKWAVGYIAKHCKHANIVIPIIPGNHDTVGAYTLGMALADYYAHDRRVNVVPTNQPRTYRRFHNTLIGYHHGHKTKPTDLALAMPTEASDLYAATDHHEWHLAHYHAARNSQLTTITEHNAIVFRVLPSISATDDWHHQRGYKSNRAATALVYHPQLGHVSTHVHRIV